MSTPLSTHDLHKMSVSTVKLPAILRFAGKGLAMVLVLLIAGGICSTQTQGGTVTAWAWDAFGQIDVPVGLSDVVAVAAGGNHSLALKADGTVIGWGSNNDGESTIPIGLSNIVAIAAGGYHSLALSKDGSVTAWGSSSVPLGLSNVVQVAAGEEFSLAVRSDGSVVEWGASSSPMGVTWPIGLGNVVEVAGGFTHALGLRDDGMVLLFQGNQASVVLGLSNIVTVAAANGFSLAVDDQGRVTAWGSDYWGSSEVPAGLVGVAAVSGGWGHSVALKGDGTVVMWGNNGENEQAIPAGLNSVVDIAAGFFHTIALVDNRSLSISRQPQNRSPFSGTDAYFSTWAKSSFPLSFQWQLNGTNIPGGTNSILKIPTTTTNANGKYCVVVSNATGTVTSSNAILHVTDSPPILMAQPTNQAVFAGTNVVFSITATGSLPLSYQWQYNGTNIALTPNGTLILTNIQVNQSGLYSVVVSNQFGITVSSNSSLIVIPFAISSQPKSQSVQETAKVSFSVTAAGLAPLAYQWQFQGTNLTLATNSSLVISNVQRSQAGAYSVIITNQYGIGISSNAYLTVQGIIVWGSFNSGNSSLTNVPANATNIIALAAGDQHCLGLRADGTVVAWGDNAFRQISVPSNLTNVVSIAAGSTHSLALRGDGTIAMWGVIANGGVTNAPANATNIAGLALGPGAQHALAVRSDGTVLDWGNSYNGASLTNIPLMARNVVGVAAGSTYGLALRSDGRVVQWGTSQFGGSLPAVPTAATNIVALATGWYGNAGLRADGTVLVWGSVYTPSSGFTNVIDLTCPRNSTFGNCDVLALRRNGTLTEYPNTVPAYATNNISVIAAGSYNGFAAAGSGPPVFPGLPINRTVASGSRAYFRAVSVGAMPISYQWNCNGTNVPGATNTVLVLTNVQPAQAGSSYTLTASNALGVATSGAMVLNEYVLENYIQPLSQSVLAGASATFTANVIGQGPFVYQWFLSGSPLPGMTNGSLMLTNVQLNQAGAYSLAVSNSYGGAVSSDAILTVSPLAISAQPQSQSAVAGDTVSFSVTASGQSPFGYQWRFNGSNLGDATNSSLIITNVQMEQAGAYSVVVSNVYGAINSYSALLTVKPLQITVQPQSHMAYLGAMTTFNVAASNLGPFFYQWQLNGAAIPGATTNPLVLPNLQLAQAGNYSVVVSNLLGAVASSNAVLSISEVAVWGDNSSGQTNLPVGLTNVIAIACGYYHTIALKANGQVVAWGYNSYGLTNLSTGLTNLATVGAGGFNNLAVRNDGTMTDWGAPFYGAADVPPGLTNVVAVAGGEYHGLALESDGSVVAWGAGTNDTGSYPNLGQAMVPSGLSNVVAIAAGGSHSMALKRDGTIVAWGDSGAAKTNVPAGLSNIVAIAAGYSHNVALKPDATVLAWGDNTYGQTNVPEGLSNVVAVTCGCWNSVALKSDGTIVVWGRNDSYVQTNIPPGLPGVRKIAAGDFHLAALVGKVAEVPMPITCSLTNIHNVSLSFWTQSGRVYAVEYKDELADTDWKTLPLAAGIDGILTLTDPSATNSHRFYRIRQW